MEETISLQEILKIIKKQLLLIISLTIVAVSIAVVISFYILTPVYQAQTQILVNRKSNSDNAYYYSWSQIETDLQIIKTYNDIIKSPVILNKVIEDLQLDTTPQISLSSEDGSKVFYIKVLDADPELAVNIANTTADIFREEIPLLMNIDNINILSEATISENTIPVSPNKKRNIAIAAVIGIMLGIGLAFLLEFLDTTIKEEKDVEEILGTPIMGIVGSIPPEKRKKYSSNAHRVRGSQNVWIEK